MKSCLIACVCLLTSFTITRQILKKEEIKPCPFCQTIQSETPEEKEIRDECEPD